MPAITRGRFARLLSKIPKRGIIDRMSANGGLRLRRFVIENYKSIRIADLEQPTNLTILVGKNNSGKSNLLDALHFLKQATSNLKAAVDARGTGPSDLALRKADVAIRLTLTFDVPADRREWLLESIFAGSSQMPPGAALATRFLSSLIYRATLTTKGYQEELATDHPILEREGLCVLRATGLVTPMATHSVHLPSGGLFTACRSLPVTRAREIPLAHSSSTSGAAYLGLHAPAQEAISEPALAYLAKAVREKILGIEWISPIRRSQAALGLSEQTELDAEASNLAGVLHTLYANDREKFETVVAEVRRIAPSILDITPRVSGNMTVLSFREKGESEDTHYRLDQVSFGLRTALAIMTKVLCAKPGSWICLEEPETHLHPQAQAILYGFLQRQSEQRRIFVATHSSVFASLAPIDSVWLVRRSETEPWRTEILHVDYDSTDKIIQELGVKPSYDFEADGVVFIEDKLGGPVYEEWAKKEGLGGRVQFIGVEGWNNMEYFANAKIIGSRRVKAQVFVIFDGDTERGNKNKTIKERLVRELGLPNNHVFTLGQSELEGYLLDAEATLAAFPELPRSVSKDTLEGFYSGWRGRRNQKGALEELFKKYGLGRFSAQGSLEIAKAMKTTPKDLVSIFKVITREIESA